MHNDHGFRLDGDGVQLDDIEKEGGCLSEFMEFIDLAKENRFGCDNISDPTHTGRGSDDMAEPTKKKSRMETIASLEEKEFREKVSEKLLW